MWPLASKEPQLSRLPTTSHGLSKSSSGTQLIFPSDFATCSSVSAKTDLGFPFPMCPKLLSAILAMGIMSIANAAPKTPQLTDLCKIQPTPQTTTIDPTTLSEIVRNRIPEFWDGFDTGFGGVPSFRPDGAPTAANATELETRLFEDPHLNDFLLIAPQSARLFSRREILQAARMRDPYRAIGKVLINDGELRSACSGALVGMNLLLTAAHCVRNITNDWTLEFIPALNAEDPGQPRPWGSAFAERCISVGLDDDYAVCQLDSTIGEKTGHLGWRASLYNGFYLGGEWSSVGYPTNFKGGNVAALEDVKIASVEDTAGESGVAKVFSSQPYVDEGWWGGPLYGQDGDDFFAVGVVSAAVDRGGYQHIFATSSFHSGGPRMGELIEYAAMEWKSVR